MDGCFSAAAPLARARFQPSSVNRPPARLNPIWVPSAHESEGGVAARCGKVGRGGRGKRVWSSKKECGPLLPVRSLGASHRSIRLQRRVCKPLFQGRRRHRPSPRYRSSVRCTKKMRGHHQLQQQGCAQGPLWRSQILARKAAQVRTVAPRAEQLEAMSSLLEVDWLMRTRNSTLALSRRITLWTRGWR